jgi:dinuclear metal center YbgI/SA1388 family protein
MVRPLNFCGSETFMVPTINDILDRLDKIAPTVLAEPWDNPGLQVGSYSQEITKIFLSLDPTLKALKSAQRRNAQLLFTHHPLIFKPLSRLDINTHPGDVIVEAAKSRVSVIAAHTNLDMAKGGINDILADLLELQNVEVLEQKDEAEYAGLGRIGDLPAAVRLSVLVEKVKRVFGTEQVKFVGREDEQVRRLAVVGGSGGSLVSLAFKKGADLLVTGDIGHHHALDAESLGIALIDAGHFHTEKTAFGAFAERLRAMVTEWGWKVVIEVDEDETDPMGHGWEY